MENPLFAGRVVEQGLPCNLLHCTFLGWARPLAASDAVFGGCQTYTSVLHSFYRPRCKKEEKEKEREKHYGENGFP